MRRPQRHKVGGAVLVADDHEFVRYGLVQTLERTFEADRVLEAGCFAEVMRQMDTKGLKLVVCDLDMPDRDGMEQISWMRRRRPEVKLAVLSGIETRDSVLAALAAGVHGYLLKSMPSEDVIDKLVRVLAGEIFVPTLVANIDEAQAVRRGLQEEAGTRPTPASTKLSPRQLQVLAGLVRGLSNKEIARELGKAEGTIKMHVGAVLRALDAANRAHAAAIGQQLLHPDNAD